MTVQKDEETGQAEKPEPDEDDAGQGENSGETENSGQTEKPEPDEDAKKKAAEMMTAYEDRPTVVLPGSAGAVSGTAVNDWIDDDGNPKNSEDAENKDDESRQEQIDKDKAWNDELRKAAAEDNKGEKRP